ncbi:MAG: hypothetical protein ACHQ4H_12515 [Ktedonobacterales bacterium]
MARRDFTWAAKRRAHDLLNRLLSFEEYAQLIVHNYLDVRSPSTPRRVYRIPAHGGFVTVYQDAQPVARLCVGPARQLPEDDVIVLHKLMIEGNEREYLARANTFPVFQAEFFRPRRIELDPHQLQ